MNNLDIEFIKDLTKKVPKPKKSFFVAGTHPELVEVTFASGRKENFLTLRCNHHIKCNCGIESLFSLFKKSKLPRAKEVLSYGKPVAYKKFVTRIIMKQRTEKYKIYGPVNEKKEKHINELMKKLDLLRDKTAEEFLELMKNKEHKVINKTKREIEKYISKNSAEINIYPDTSMADMVNKRRD